MLTSVLMEECCEKCANIPRAKDGQDHKKCECGRKTECPN